MDSSNQVIVFAQRPSDFAPKVETAACYLEVEDKLLLLQNASHKSEATRWGVPAGKLEPLEVPEATAVRELWEETGIAAPVCFVATLYVRKPEIDYVYHMFKVLLDQMPCITLSDEHEKHAWVSRGEMQQLSLMIGAKEALQTYYSWKENRC